MSGLCYKLITLFIRSQRWFMILSENQHLNIFLCWKWKKTSGWNIAIPRCRLMAKPASEREWGREREHPVHVLSPRRRLSLMKRGKSVWPTAADTHTHICSICSTTDALFAGNECSLFTSLFIVAGRPAWFLCHFDLSFITPCLGIVTVHCNFPSAVLRLRNSVCSTWD